MIVEKSAGAVIFRREKNKIFYLVLHYPFSGSSSPKEGHWDFPKGHIEKGETIEQTIKREVKEETGIDDLKFIEGFKETIRYFFKRKEKMIMKFVTFLLAKTRKKEIKLSFEHLGFEWAIFEDAKEKITFRVSKEILEKANKFLEKLHQE
jgi:8-oxo-dGTP pyrophosphatase MutT (NUDIX family)